MPPTRRWIRLDVTWEDSAWLDALPGEAAGCWPRLLCVVKRDGVKGRCRRPNLDVIARRWRVSRESIDALESAAISDGALSIEDDEWVVVNWSEYQDTDKTAVERKRKQRAKSSGSNVPSRVTAGHGESRTVPRDNRDGRCDLSRDVDVDVDVDVDQKPSASLARKRAHQLPPVWEPSDAHRSIATERGVDIDLETTQFRDHAAANGRTLKDWDAGFRMWLRKAFPRQPKTSNGARPRTEITADYLAAVLLSAGSLVWAPSTRDEALQRLSERYDDDEWGSLGPYFVDMPWAEVVPAHSDRFLLREVLNHHIERHDHAAA